MEHFFPIGQYQTIEIIHRPPQDHSSKRNKLTTTTKKASTMKFSNIFWPGWPQQFWNGWESWGCCEERLRQIDERSKESQVPSVCRNKRSTPASAAYKWPSVCPASWNLCYLSCPCCLPTLPWNAAKLSRFASRVPLLIFREPAGKSSFSGMSNHLRGGEFLCEFFSGFCRSFFSFFFLFLEVSCAA